MTAGLILDQYGRPYSPDRAPGKAKFDLAQTNADNRNHWVNADGLSARAALNPAVRKLQRERSRYEAENNSWYAGILSTATNHIIGTGPRLQVLTKNAEGNARLERAWTKWASDSGLADKLAVAFESYWRDGDDFIVRTKRPSLWPIQLDVRVLESEQCQDPWNKATFLDTHIDDGIRFTDTNELEFWFLDRHPTDPAYSPVGAGNWWPARDVIHLFKPVRPGQLRGIPRLAPGLPILAVMRRFEMATVHAAEAVANVALYLKTNGGTPAESDSEPFSEAPTARNSMMLLPEGHDLFQPKMENPNSNLEMFCRQMLMAFARAANIPYGLMAGTSKDSNFSSYKGDIRAVWAPEVLCEQARMGRVVMDKIWRWFLEEAVFVPGLLDGMPPLDQIDHQWFWDELPPLDELDAANAAEKRIASGQSTLPQEYADRGLDFDTAMQRGADGFGVPVEQYKAAIFNQLFGVAPASQAPAPPAATPAAAGGTYTELGQRAFRNNMKRIASMLDEVAAGTLSPARATVFMQQIGVDQSHIDALLADVADGQLDDTELAGVR